MFVLFEQDCELKRCISLTPRIVQNLNTTIKLLVVETPELVKTQIWLLGFPDVRMWSYITNVSWKNFSHLPPAAFR